VSVLPVPRVQEEDRYVVDRVDSLPGFYGVAQYIGFRDEPALHVEEIVMKIHEVEARRGPTSAGQIGNQLMEYSHKPTHVYVLLTFDLGYRVLSSAMQCTALLGSK
jgi:KUP system potassium uptake protein